MKAWVQTAREIRAELKTVGFKNARPTVKSGHAHAKKGAVEITFYNLDGDLYVGEADRETLVAIINKYTTATVPYIHVYYFDENKPNSYGGFCHSIVPGQ